MARLEQLDIWKSARETARLAYTLTMDARIGRHYALIDQIRRSGISIPSNVAEGYGLGTRSQFVRMARIALGSAYELQTQLYLVGDLDLAPGEALNEALVQCGATIKLVTALIRSLGGTLGQ